MSGRTAKETRESREAWGRGLGSCCHSTPGRTILANAWGTQSLIKALTQPLQPAGTLWSQRRDFDQLPLVQSDSKSSGLLSVPPDRPS